MLSSLMIEPLLSRCSANMRIAPAPMTMTPAASPSRPSMRLTAWAMPTTHSTVMSVDRSGGSGHQAHERDAEEQDGHARDGQDAAGQHRPRGLGRGRHLPQVVELAHRVHGQQGQHHPEGRGDGAEHGRELAREPGHQEAHQHAGDDAGPAQDGRGAGDGRGGHRGAARAPTRNDSARSRGMDAKVTAKAETMTAMYPITPGRARTSSRGRRPRPAPPPPRPRPGGPRACGG